MNIFILEDDIIQQQYLNRIVKNIISERRQQEYSLFATSRPNDIFERIEEGTNNLYFLDIEIKSDFQAGFELAKRIRKVDSYGLIVFVTTHSEFLPMTFQYKLMALDFIEKNQSEENFLLGVKEVINTAIDRFKTTNSTDVFSFNNQKSSFKIMLSDILFFETTEIPHKVRLVTASKHSEFVGTLKEIEKQNTCFFMCHKSYVVNVNNIYSINKKERIIEFKDTSETCYVSRKYMAALLKKMK